MQDRYLFRGKDLDGGERPTDNQSGYDVVSIEANGITILVESDESFFEVIDNIYDKPNLLKPTQ